MEILQPGVYPPTRYQGSKAKIVEWIADVISDLDFETIMDAFGGTGVVAYKMKQLGKNVVYNDAMKFNSVIAKALIENTNETLTAEEVEELLEGDATGHPTFIEDTFQGIFYLNEENIWLDEMVYKIRKMENEYKRAIAWFALFQACIIKRPYNLFHRANLSVRMSTVKRSFGNKKTWDTPFPVHFRKFVEEANCAVFDNNKKITVLNQDALTINPEEIGIDAVYIDTPYVSGKGTGTDYVDFYSFVEGMVDYDNWGDKILTKYKHKPIVGKNNYTWTKKDVIYNSFDKLFRRYKDQLLIISYREDGIPTIKELIDILSQYKKDITQVHTTGYKYVLSKKETKEVLIIAK